MLERLIHYFHRMQEVLKDINFGFIFEIVINLAILTIIFKILDLCEEKTKGCRAD